MSKYDALWHYIARQDTATLTLSFAEVGDIAGVPLDHSFLSYKKELTAFGWEVEKISLKGETVRFRRISRSTTAPKPPSDEVAPAGATKRGTK